MTGVLMLTKGGGCGGGESRCGKETKRTSEEQNQLSIVALLLAAIRRSMVSCRVEQQEEVISSVNRMEIGWPTNVQHITHVTFDRFEGFLGLPVEFEVEVPCRVPSASASVFGVSAESMQCSFDSKGNSVPTILLLMQERLYTQGGLKAEGIFRINPENSQEEQVRDQLNRGIVPDNIDVHCLAGLIKAWFRELPEGILDGLSPEEVLQCNTEDECVDLVKKLLPIPAALLNWAVDLMTDVVEEEESNKMNARNIAMVFAPNMTQMSDPLTALMHAVQVMNLLKTLILKTLREREETATVEGEGYSPFSSRSSDRQTGEDSDSQQEEMDTSCELKGSRLNYYVHNCYSTSSEDEEEDEDIDPLSEIEENFLRQFDGKEELTSEVIEESTMNLGMERLSPSSFSGYNAESTMNLGMERLSPSSFSGYNAESTMNLGVVEQLSPSSFSGYNAESTMNLGLVEQLSPSSFSGYNAESNKDLGTEQLSPSSLSGNNAESTRDIRMEGLSPGSFSGYNAESGFTYSDSKNESSGLSMSDAEDSVVTATGEIANSSSTHLEERHDDERIEDTVMVEKLGGVVLT